MRILVHGNASLGEGYPRNRVLLGALAHAGATLVWNHEALFHSPRERKRLVHPARLARTLPRLLYNRWRLARGARLARGVDALFVPYGGLGDLGTGRRIADRLGVPLIHDAFLSLHEALVWDRAVVPAGSLRARLALARDRALLRAVDLLLVDTHETGALFSDLFGVHRARLLPVPVGSDLARQPLPPEQARGRFLFVGTGVPLHGTHALLGAWAVVERRAPHVRLTFVGGTAEDRRRAEHRGLRTVVFVDRFVDATELANLHGACDLALGVFAPRPKTARVVPCKVFDALACGRGVASLATPALLRLCPPGSGVLPVASARPDVLAATLLASLEPGVARAHARAAREHHARCFSPAALARTLCDALAVAPSAGRAAPGAGHGPRAPRIAAASP